MTAGGYPLLLKQLWHTPIAQAADQEIVYRDLRRFTFRQLRERIGRLASGLASFGVREGDTVGILDWDSNRFLEAFFAVPMMGAVLHTVNVRLTPEQLAYTIDHGGSTVLFVNDDFVPIMESIRDRLPKVKRLIRMSDKPAPEPAGLHFDREYEELLAGGSPDYEFGDFDENRIATTYYTSGTTGLPKGVRFSHRQLVLHTLSQLAFFGMAAGHGRFTREDVYMPLTPMFHAHAWGMPWAATLAGAKQVYPGRYEPAMLVKLIKTEGVTFTHGVPTLLQMLLRAATEAKTDLAGLKMIVGGSELPHALVRQALNLGVDAFAGYGMSESAPMLTVAQVKSQELQEGSDAEVDLRTRSGLAAPLVDLRLADSRGAMLPNDGETRGEILVRAPWLTKAYTGDPQASHQLWAGGYMHTGDIGVIEPNGYLRVVDRIKDVIKTGGEWVSSIEVEDLISQYKGVSEAAVIGVPSEKWGERPLAVVVRDGSSQITSAEIKAHLESSVEAGAIPKFAIPDEIIFVTAIPRTSVGKFDKKALGEQYARGSLAVAAEDSGNASFLGDRSSAVMTGRREP